MDDSITLRGASVQEIQLELVRRTQFNAMDGEKGRAAGHLDIWDRLNQLRPAASAFAQSRQALM